MELPLNEVFGEDVAPSRAKSPRCLNRLSDETFIRIYDNDIIWC